MFASRIETAEASLAPATANSVRAGLPTLAVGLDTRFVQAGTTLTHIIETVDQFRGRLDAMHEALSPEQPGGAIADLREASRLISEVPVRSSSREALLSGFCHAAAQLEKD